MLYSYIKGNITQLITRGTTLLTASRAGPKTPDQDLSIRTEQGSPPKDGEKQAHLFWVQKRSKKPRSADQKSWHPSTWPEKIGSRPH